MTVLIFATETGETTDSDQLIESGKIEAEFGTKSSEEIEMPVEKSPSTGRRQKTFVMPIEQPKSKGRKAKRAKPGSHSGMVVDSYGASNSIKPAPRP